MWRSWPTRSRRRQRSREPTSTERWLAGGHSWQTQKDTRTGNDNMTQKHPRKRTSSARRILRRIAGKDPKVLDAIAEQKLNVRVAEMLLKAREAAQLTQAQVARLVGTTQSVISRLEDADYEGHSLTMLQRIAEALNRCVEIRFLAPEKLTRGRRPNTAI